MARSGLLLMLLFFLVLHPDPFQTLMVSGLEEEKGMMKREEGREDEGFGGETRHASVGGGGHKAGSSPAAMNHHTHSPPASSDTCNNFIHFRLSTPFAFAAALSVSLFFPYI